MQYPWTGMALKEFFFFERLCFSENDIGMLLFVFFGWEIGHPLTTYAAGGNRGEVIKNVDRCVQREGSWKIGHKIRTY